MLVLIRDCVRSGLCPFGIVSIRDRVRDPIYVDLQYFDIVNKILTN